MEIRETEDDPDVRLLADFTGAGLGSWWTSTRATHQEYKHYESGNGQGLQMFFTPIWFQIISAIDNKG
jgi:hypothetical protein